LGKARGFFEAVAGLTGELVRVEVTTQDKSIYRQICRILSRRF
jgi:hypothetical protein